MLEKTAMDPLFRVETIAATPNPQQCVYAGMHQDYDEGFVMDSRETWPDETKAGEICVKRLLAGERGHYGPLEHAQIVLNVGWFPHSVMQQARTHRVGCCLSSDTIVYFGHDSLSGGEVYYESTIGHLFDLWHNGRSHQRTEADAAYMRRQIGSRKLMHLNEQTGLIETTSITNIYGNGPKEIWCIRLEDGKEIKATLNHQVFTPNGWTTFGELKPGDSVMTAASLPLCSQSEITDATNDQELEQWKTCANFPWYEVSTCGRVRSWAPRKHRGKQVYPMHPRLKKVSKGTYSYVSLASEEGTGSKRVNVHTLVLETFVGTRPPDGVARHLNGVAHDNRLSNLSWGTQAENASDRSLHGVTRRKKGIAVKIASISYVGTEETYDLAVEGPYHNFIANGIVVHNSFDVQSMRYTGDRICRAARGELHLEDVFYLRPVGYYSDRKGKKYHYSEHQRNKDLCLCRRAALRYEELILSGFAEEHARGILPFDYRQHFVVSFSLRAFLHFLDLRAKLDAQKEIRDLCELMWPHLQQWTPEFAEWYEKTRLHKARLAP